MTTLKEDIEIAHKLIDEKTSYYGIFDRIWPFTTINMKEYLEIFNLANKKCITIQGSSDHIFELFLKNPEKIVGVDINPLTKYLYYLKKAAFSALETPEEYLKFFRWYDYPEMYYKNQQVFDKDVFTEMEKYLTDDAKIFWKEMYSCHDPIKIRTKMFNEYDEADNATLYKALNYLEKDNYEYIRNNIDKINYTFINEDIRNLNKRMTENYDFITLTNLIMYANHMYEHDAINNYKKLIETLSSKLNIKGNIIVGYLYDAKILNDTNKIYIDQIEKSVFNEKQYRYYYFTKIHDLYNKCEPTGYDACLIYTKK